MRTFIKSAGFGVNADYAWWELEKGSLKNVSDSGPTVANALIKKTGEDGLTERLINDEYFALVLRKDPDTNRIHLLVYLPAPKLGCATEKKYRIDYTGQRAIRTGFAWEAEDDDEDEKLRKRAIAFLDNSDEILIDQFEPCFYIAIEEENKKPGFRVLEDKLINVLNQLKPVTLNPRDNSPQKPDRGTYWIVQDDLDHRKDIYKSISSDPDIFVVVDRYINNETLRDCDGIQYVLSLSEKSITWKQQERLTEDNGKVKTVKDRIQDFNNSLTKGQKNALLGGGGGVVVFAALSAAMPPIVAAVGVVGAVFLAKKNNNTEKK